VNGAWSPRRESNPPVPTREARLERRRFHLSRDRAGGLVPARAERPRPPSGLGLRHLAEPLQDLRSSLRAQPVTDRSDPGQNEHQAGRDQGRCRDQHGAPPFGLTGLSPDRGLSGLGRSTADHPAGADHEACGLLGAERSAGSPPRGSLGPFQTGRVAAQTPKDLPPGPNKTSQEPASDDGHQGQERQCPYHCALLFGLISPRYRGTRPSFSLASRQSLGSRTSPLFEPHRPQRSL
jgi:hypothetical protein